jgi:hypothetical protein
LPLNTFYGMVGKFYPDPLKERECVETNCNWHADGQIHKLSM